MLIVINKPVVVTCKSLNNHSWWLDLTGLTTVFILFYGLWLHNLKGLSFLRRYMLSYEVILQSTEKFLSWVYCSPSLIHLRYVSGNNLSTWMKCGVFLVKLFVFIKLKLCTREHISMYFQCINYKHIIRLKIKLTPAY